MDAIELIPGEDILRDGHGGEGIGSLEDHPHHSPCLHGAYLHQVSVVEEDLSLGTDLGVEVVHAIDRPEEGTLTASAGTHDGGNEMLVEGAIDALDRPLLRCVGDGEIANLDDRREILLPARLVGREDLVGYGDLTPGLSHDLRGAIGGSGHTNLRFIRLSLDAPLRSNGLGSEIESKNEDQEEEGGRPDQVDEVGIVVKLPDQQADGGGGAGDVEIDIRGAEGGDHQRCRLAHHAGDGEEDPGDDRSDGGGEQHVEHDGGVGAAEGETRLEEGAWEHIECLLGATGDHRDHHQCEGDRTGDGAVAVHGSHHPHIDEDAADDRRHALEDIGKRADEDRHLLSSIDVEVDAAEETEGDRDE